MDDPGSGMCVCCLVRFIFCVFISSGRTQFLMHINRRETVLLDHLLSLVSRHDGRM